MSVALRRTRGGVRSRLPAVETFGCWYRTETSPCVNSHDRFRTGLEQLERMKYNRDHINRNAECRRLIGKSSHSVTLNDVVANGAAGMMTAQNMSMPKTMPHIAQLDGIRAISVGLVFLSHAGLGQVVPGGLGVAIFFFLSGYLITTLMRFEKNRAGRINLTNFYLRRVFRIFPPLYLTLSFGGVLYAFGVLRGPYEPFSVLAQATFTTNYVSVLGGKSGYGLPLPLWSLAVEEHFYLVFPLIFMASRISAARLAACCLVACVVVLGFRISAVLVLTDASDTYIWTHTRIDSILFGCCLALWRNPIADGERAYRPGGVQASLAVVVLGVTVLVRDETFRETLRYTIQGGALFVLFAAILQPAAGGICDRVARLLSTPILLRIGAYSYTIYLVHGIMIDTMVHLDASFLVQGLIALALTLVYAALMYRLVERPFARLRRRLEVSDMPPHTPLDISAVLPVAGK